MDNFDKLRERMVDDQLVRRGISNESVLEAMKRIKRDLFVPDKEKKRSYYDGPLPIGMSQTISQPYIVASMTEVLEPESDDRVLEIGTGSGYQTAVLAELVREVLSVERIEELSVKAEKLLKRELGYKNILIKTGDGKKGWPEQAPFDKIIVTAAAEKFPVELFNQLKEGGIAVAPVGETSQYLYKFVKLKGEIRKTVLYPVSFVPLI